jgi:hypothetical protein
VSIHNPAAAASACSQALTLVCCRAAGGNSHAARMMSQPQQQACSLLLCCSGTRILSWHCCQACKVRLRGEWLCSDAQQTNKCIMHHRPRANLSNSRYLISRCRPSRLQWHSCSCAHTLVTTANALSWHAHQLMIQRCCNSSGRPMLQMALAAAACCPWMLLAGCACGTAAAGAAWTCNEQHPCRPQ